MYNKIFSGYQPRQMVEWRMANEDFIIWMMLQFQQMNLFMTSVVYIILINMFHLRLLNLCFFHVFRHACAIFRPSYVFVLIAKFAILLHVTIYVLLQLF
jgi:hypothetical protein